MTAEQIQAYVNTIQPALAKLKNDIAAHQQTSNQPSWQDLIKGAVPNNSGQQINAAGFSYTFQDSSGNTTTAVPKALVHGPGSPPICPAWGCGPCPPRICTGPIGGIITDNDQDGLPDDLESAVADNFTPYYGISSGEPDQFATFGDYVPMTVTSLVGTVPPFSYYRVQPLGLTTDNNGNQLFALRIDYLSLWNADNGLVGGGGACWYSYVGLDQVINQVTSHDLDVERSGMLVAAPAVNGGYNPDANAYGLYAVYTAAHEGTFFDQSMYGVFSPAVSAGNHLLLDLSLAKHSTYGFNPDYYPITPQWFIDDYNATMFALWQDEDISEDEYYFSIAVGNATFYGCIVERFSDQGRSFANQRINVGEPNHPMNGSAFIQDDSDHALHIYSKLITPLF